MSHFYGSMQGGRGETTRTGTKNSGITAHARTYTAGVDVMAMHTSEGDDVFDVTITGGSNGPTGPTFLRLTSETLRGILEGRARLAVVPIGDGGEGGAE